MAISLPSEPVYYYECSAGNYRLVYFIPPNRLRQLRDQGDISQAALDDFPDGVDLDCTEPDFKEFEDSYGYRPERSPDALGRAFFAIFSATHEWEKFRGSGFIPAADLERQVEMVDTSLQAGSLMPEEDEPLPEQPTLEQRRQRTGFRVLRNSQMRVALEKLRPEGIDPQQSLRQQKFSSIRWEGEQTAEEVFSRLHQKRKG